MSEQPQAIRTRLAWARVDPEARQAMLRLDQVGADQIDPTLRGLIWMRASHLNGCAFCLDLHSADAAERGETLQRLVVVGAWNEAPHLFTEREQAALALTDAVTRLGPQGVPDAVWAAATEQFDEKELVRVLMAIVTINGWNRLAVATHAHVRPRR
ncbi:carboxymuconolactone decarboxylase family protein [Actinoallomurus sp. NBC_01490]|uniref:carboxymuconolactone decarboxylase family protein n=1 Tax=Actinoallomurus sp. NBC_01490 TaxID=2903557 RepID=UPI002E33783F|nr:carboxymuconolactone decarboxylase family protein [Actinoallomurus sp. NBC_01490]